MKKPAPVTPEEQDRLRTLNRAQNLIQRQQQGLNYLRPKAEAYDVLCSIVRTMTPSMPYSVDEVEDVSGRLQVEIDTITKRIETSQPATE